ncbi:MAG: HPr family phosphocarrier protein [Alphaproteobacteria bacterium]|nr:HPr family phosphocarrier protein [Alphaproteobacteria bacterium]
MDDTSTGAVLLTHKIGLHARPSVKLTKLAKRFDAKVELAADAAGPWIDAKSVNKVMQAKIPQNVTLQFRAEGAEAAAAVAALIALVEADFTDVQSA